MPIAPEAHLRLLLALSRDAALDPLDVRVAVELADKLAGSTRTRLDIDTLTTNVSASAVGVRNALDRLCAAGCFADTGSWRGYAGHSYALMLDATTITFSAEGS